MTDFQIKLADRVIQIKSLHKGVFDLCEGYLCISPENDMEVLSSQEAIDRERERAGEEENPSDDYLETLSVYRSIAEQMLDYSTFLVHASVVAKDQEAFAFLAASGVGKTTRTNLWLEELEDSYVVNGDKPLLRICDHEVWACGTPWSGKERMNRNCQIPLRALCFLERADEEAIHEMDFSQAFVRMLSQVYRPKNQMALAKTLRLVKAMEGKVKFYQYRSKLEDVDMRKLYQQMKGW